MSIATWPSALPQLVEEQGYSGTAGDNVLRTDMEVGPPKQRVNTRVNGRQVTLAVYMDRDQYVNTFLDWWANAVAYGALNFEWTDPATEATAELRITDVYRERAESGYLRVEIPVEIVP